MPEGRPRGRRGHGGSDRGHRRRNAPPNELRPPFPVDELAPDEALDTLDAPAEGEESGDPSQVREGAEGSVDLNSLYKMGNQQVLDAAKRLGIEGATSMRKQDLIFEI